MGAQSCWLLTTRKYRRLSNSSKSLNPNIIRQEGSFLWEMWHWVEKINTFDLLMPKKMWLAQNFVSHRMCRKLLSGTFWERGEKLYFKNFFQKVIENYFIDDSNWTDNINNNRFWIRVSTVACLELFFFFFKKTVPFLLKNHNQLIVKFFKSVLFSKKMFWQNLKAYRLLLMENEQIE